MYRLAMGYAHGTAWSDELVKDRLLEHSASMGRMPTANELRSLGEASLASRIANTQGYRYWQLKLGLKNKGSETHRAQRWERWSRSAISENTGLKVEHQTTRSPFDLLVGGKVKVDVKCSMWHDYPMKSGSRMRGYMFAGCKYGETCDMFFLVCLHECGERVKYVFAVPSDVAQVQTITITERRIRTWDGFRNENAYTVISDLTT